MEAHLSLRDQNIHHLSSLAKCLTDVGIVETFLEQEENAASICFFGSSVCKDLDLNIVVKRQEKSQHEPLARRFVCDP